jgi:His-Xaa-Ser repeat protein HxsA
VNGNADRSSKRIGTERDAGPSTLTTPLFPLNGSDGDSVGTPSVTTQPTVHKGGRKSASSRALNAVVRATTQVAVSTHVEPTAPPKVVRPSPRSSVVLTETEKLRLQIMQVQIKLTGLGLYDGAIDGAMNPDLVDAVRYFQTLKGMRDSGVLTSGTLTALGIHPIA